MNGNGNDQGAQCSTRRQNIAYVPNARVLAAKRLEKGYVATTVELEDSTSLQFGDAGHVMEIICKGGRVLSSYPWRPDPGGGRGEDHIDPAPKPPGRLAPV
jgi:hypothetical protein